MFKAKDLPMLYWANIKKFLRDSFNYKRNSLVTLTVPLWHLLLLRLIELVLFIPNIIIFPFIRTIVDFYTREPIDQAEIDTLSKKLESIYQNNNSAEFDRFVDGLCDKVNLYQSFESQQLIIQVRHAKIEFFQQIRVAIDEYLKNENLNFSPEKKDRFFCELIEVRRRVHSFFNAADKKDCVLSSNFMSRWKMAYELDEKQWELLVTKHPSGGIVKTQYAPVSEEYKTCFRAEQLEKIKAYICNPNNNGKKLMQYIRMNLSEDMLSDKREIILKGKAQEEINRLEKETTSVAKEKATAIRAACEHVGKSFDENQLRSSLLIHRGFFKAMPDSYANVFCSTRLNTRM